jgi:hypothetical protein
VDPFVQLALQLGLVLGVAVATGLNALGAVGVVLAVLARETGLVDERLFVALVTMALGTSALAGVALPRVLGTAVSSAGTARRSVDRA